MLDSKNNINLNKFIYEQIAYALNGLLFTFLLPVFEIALFFLTVGGEPQNLKFAIVNEEIFNYTSCNDFRYKSTIVKRDDCEFSGLSCAFLTDLFDSPDTQYFYDYFSDFDDAKNEVANGKYVGIINFSENFTHSLKSRLWDGSETDNRTLESSEIRIWLDMTDGQTAILLQRKFYDTYNRFSESLFNRCQLSPKIGTIPIHFYSPVYGNVETNYGHFAAPGCIVTLIFFLAVTVTSIIIIEERDEGVWSRSLVAGVTTSEVLLSHFLTQGLVMMLQTAEVMIVSYGLFRIPCRGSIVTLTALLLSQGLCGMAAGFAISIWCDNVISSNYVSMGSFVPIIFLSGSIWPIEGMPHWLKTIALGFPTTLATQSVRSVMEKGTSFFDTEVLIGYGVSLTWIAVLFLFSAIMLRYKGV